MNILVTGGAGFIGTNLIKELVKNEKDTVISLDNYLTGSSNNHQRGAIYKIGDIREIHNIFKNDIDYVFHLAAHSRIQPSFKHPLETYDVNTNGTLMILDWARNNKVKKVIYSGSSSRWHNPIISPYATSKKLGEDLCKMYREVYNLNVDIARFYNVYGEHEILHGDWAAVIGKWRGQIEEGKRITIVGDGTQRRAFTHIDDIVNGLIKILKYNKNHEDAWELGVGINYSINEIAEMFKETLNCRTEHIPNRPGEYKETIRENDDALKRLNWSPSDKLYNYIRSLK